MIKKISILALTAICIAAVFASAVQATPFKVPAGNRHAKQPPIPGGSKSRTKATNGSFEAKYLKIRDHLARDKKLAKKIKKAAARYKIDPVHIVGALVGEHTYNVDALDHIQTYYVKAMSYLGTDISFKYEKEHVTKFVQRPQFSACGGMKNEYDLWSCRERIWNTKFRGKNTGGKKWPNNRFGRVFFQPLYAGQTFGLGQLNPLTALSVSDMVKKISQLPRLSAKKAPQVYKAIMDPNSTLHYMAAIIRTSIDSYKRIANMDIGGNPGITATLYNLGDVKFRAQKLRAKNKKRKASGKKPILPEENYYGWLVNSKMSELANIIR
ncbi:MAG: DUF1402 family protein [Rhizobiaceae bacterium]|nr:DUF1402 family protein [Rhizobiaceae bacterium]